MISSAFTLILITFFGGLIFFGLERKTALNLNAQYIAFMQQLNTTLSCVATTDGACASLTPGNGTAMYTALINSYMQDPTTLTDVWSPTSASVYLFAFTIVSTIGYGTFAPKTPGGQVFTIFYALVTIPVGGVALGKVAGTLLELGEWFLYMILSGRISRAFKESNRSGDGVLDYDDMRMAIQKAQGHEIHPEDFNEAVAEFDPFETHEISHATFTAIYLKVDKDEMQDVRATDRAKVCSLIVIGWLTLGMFYFSKAEGWTNVESMYFGVVTLTTIGFGDYYPTTPAGTGFHFLFCIFGLGFVATLLGALSALAAGGGGGDDEEEEEEGGDGDKDKGGDDDKADAKGKGKKAGTADDVDRRPQGGRKRIPAAMVDDLDDVLEDRPVPRRRLRRKSSTVSAVGGQTAMQSGARHSSTYTPRRGPTRGDRGYDDGDDNGAPQRRPAPRRGPPPQQAPVPEPAAVPQPQPNGLFGLPGIPLPPVDPLALFNWGGQQPATPPPPPPAPASQPERPPQRRPAQRPRPPPQQVYDNDDVEAAEPPPRPAPRRKPRPVPNDDQ